MLESDWLTIVPGGTWEGGVDFLNSLSWNIKWRNESRRWKAFAGDRLLVAVETKAELGAFILGMAIGLRVLPEAMLADIRKLVAE